MMNTAIAEIPFQGHAEFDDQYSQLDKELFTDKKDTLDKKDVIEMTVSQVLDGSFSLEGDEFFAEVTSDVMGDKGVIIPKGTVAHGTIIQTSEAKRLGRDGHLSLSFDYLVTPDGREIPIEGKMSTKLHPLKAATKIIATDVGYTAVGGVAGGMVGQRLHNGASVRHRQQLRSGLAHNGAALGNNAALGKVRYAADSADIYAGQLVQRADYAVYTTDGGIHQPDDRIQRGFYQRCQPVKNAAENLFHARPGAFPIAGKNATDKINDAVKHLFDAVPNIFYISKKYIERFTQHRAENHCPIHRENTLQEIVHSLQQRLDFVALGSD